MNFEHDPHLQTTQQMILGALEQEPFEHNHCDLSFLMKDCNSTKPECGVPLVALTTTRSSFSFSEVIMSVSRPTKRAAASGQIDRGTPPSFETNSVQPSKLEIKEFGEIYSKPPPSVKFDVAVVPQEEWDQLFELALKAVSRRIVTPVLDT